MGDDADRTIRIIVASLFMMIATSRCGMEIILPLLHGNCDSFFRKYLLETLVENLREIFLHGLREEICPYTVYPSTPRTY